jgi:hypothetical protein
MHHLVTDVELAPSGMGCFIYVSKTVSLMTKSRDGTSLGDWPVCQDTNQLPIYHVLPSAALKAIHQNEPSSLVQRCIEYNIFYIETALF